MRESCGNERLTEILTSPARQTMRYTQLGLATLVRRKESARNWRTMRKTLKAGIDTAAAAAES